MPKTDDDFALLREQTSRIIKEGQQLREQSRLLINHARWVARQCEHACAVAARLREYTGSPGCAAPGKIVLLTRGGASRSGTFFATEPRGG